MASRDSPRLLWLRRRPRAVWGFLTDPQRVARCMPGAPSPTGSTTRRSRAHGGQGRPGHRPATRAKVTFEAAGPLRAHRGDHRHGPGRPRAAGGADLRLTSSIKEVSPGETEVTAASKVKHHRHPGADGTRHGPGRQRPSLPVFSHECAHELEPSAAAPPPAPSPVAAAPAPSAAPIAAAAGARPAAPRRSTWFPRGQGGRPRRCTGRPTSAFLVAVAAAASCSTCCSADRCTRGT